MRTVSMSIIKFLCRFNDLVFGEKSQGEFDMREVKIIQYGVGAMGSLMVKTALKRKGLRFVGAILSQTVFPSELANGISSRNVT
jgi:hypothetical protein